MSDWMSLVLGIWSRPRYSPDFIMDAAVAKNMKVSYPWNAKGVGSVLNRALYPLTNFMVSGMS